MTHIKIEEITRRHIAEFFPSALLKALGSYQDFMDTEKNIEDSKKYAEHQKAGKVAIAHIQLLFKLAEWAEVAKPESTPDIQMLLGAAQEDITRFRDEEFLNCEFEEVDGS